MIYLSIRKLSFQNLKATWKLFLSSERKDFKSAVVSFGFIFYADFI